MSGSCRRDSLRVQLNKCCLPAPPAIEQRVHVMKVRADRQIANNHLSPSCSCSSTSISCGDPTPRALPCAPKTRTKPHPHVQSHHNLTGQRFVDAPSTAPEQASARRNWAVLLWCHSLKFDVANRVGVSVDAMWAIRALISPSRIILLVIAHRIANVIAYFHVTITMMLKIQEYRQVSPKCVVTV